MQTKSILIILLTCLFASSCKQKSIVENPEKLCVDFYKLNRYANLNPLLNTSILGLREYSVYNKREGKLKRISLYTSIRDTISGDYVHFRAYPHWGSITTAEKQKYYNHCDSLCIAYLKKHSNKSQSPFSNYCSIIDTAYHYYLKIKVPNELPYDNIEINGDGLYIQFVLYDNEATHNCYSCYYFKDSTVNLDIQKHMKRIDSHWYYYIH